MLSSSNLAALSRTSIWTEKRFVCIVSLHTLDILFIHIAPLCLSKA